MMKLTSNLKTLIEVYGVDRAMQIIDILLTQQLETIDELSDSIADELYYATQD